MKTKNFLLTLLALAFILSIPNVTYSHAENRFHSNCTWWKKRYRSEARLYTLLGLVPLCYSARSSCGEVAVACSNSCGDAAASAGPGTNFILVSTSNLCGGGMPHSDLYRKLFDYEDESKSDSRTMISSFTYDNYISEGNSTYVVENGNGHLFIDKKTIGFVSLKFMIWNEGRKNVYEGELTDIEEDKKYLEEEITIRNNELILSSRFKDNSGITIEETEEYFKVIFKDFSARFPLPNNIEVEDLAISVIGYADADNDRMRDRFLAEDKGVRISPNPSEGEIQVDLSNLSTESISLDIFSMEGKKIKNLGVFNPLIESVIHLSDLNIPNGTYLLLVNGEGILEVNKLVIIKNL